MVHIEQGFKASKTRASATVIIYEHRTYSLSSMPVSCLSKTSSNKITKQQQHPNAGYKIHKSTQMHTDKLLAASYAERCRVPAADLYRHELFSPALFPAGILGPAYFTDLFLLPFSKIKEFQT